MNKRKIITHMLQFGSQSDPFQNDPDFSSKTAIYRMKILDKKPLLIPGYIDDVSPYEACGLLEFFKIQGWMHLLTDTCPIYPDLMKRFYVNFKRNPETGILSSQVKGHVITLDENFLARLLNIPAQGWVVNSVHDWTESPFSPLEQTKLFMCDDSKVEAYIPHAVDIPFQIKVIQNLCYRILYPRDPEGVRCKPCDLFLVSMLLTGKPVNLPKSMLLYMETVWTKRMALPFTGVLTHIFKNLGIDLSKEAHVDKEPFPMSLLRRVQLNAYFYRVLYRSVQEDTQQGVPSQVGPLLLLQAPAKKTNEPSTSELPPPNDSSIIEELKSRVATLERTVQMMQKQQEQATKTIDTLLQVLSKTQL